MGKGDDREKNGGEKTGEKKKIKTFIVATNLVASRPPKRRPTGTSTARANIAGHPVSIKIFKFPERAYVKNGSLQ